jgi:iron complex outermembrane receptor protein
LSEEPILKLKLLSAVGVLSTIAHWITIPVIAETSVIPIVKVQDLPRAATTVEKWLAQESVTSSVVEVTGIQLNPTTDGLQIVLQAVDQLGQAIVTSEGNTWVATIPNAQLLLPNGQPFQSDTPAPNIATVSVTQIKNQIQVRVTGSNGLPEVSIVPNQTGFLVDVTPFESEEEIVVTAQKRPELSQNVPISLTVIPRQTLEDAQIDSFQKIANNTPNFSFFPTNAGGSDFSY